MDCGHRPAQRNVSATERRRVATTTAFRSWPSLRAMQRHVTFYRSTRFRSTRVSWACSAPLRDLPEVEVPGLEGDLEYISYNWNNPAEAFRRANEYRIMETAVEKTAPTSHPDMQRPQ